jgi:hypothetical protein
MGMGLAGVRLPMAYGTIDPARFNKEIKNPFALIRNPFALSLSKGFDKLSPNGVD